MDKKIRVLLVDDESIVAEAIATVLQLDTKVKVVGIAVNAVMALQKARALQPDVILLDLRLPDQPGVELIAELHGQAPATRIVIVTGYADDREVALAFRSGAVGYVLKTQAPSELVRAIENAHLGRSSVPPSVAKIMLQMINPPKPVEPLTKLKLDNRTQAAVYAVKHGLASIEDAQLARR